MNLRLLTYAEHEALRQAKVSATKPRGYRLRAAERKREDLHQRLRAEVAGPLFARAAE